MAAQKFIHKNDLPQAYLEQVANFIIKNADKVTMQAVQEDFADPFTGGGRYVPSGNSQPTNNVNVNFRERSGMVNVDPFTGGSSYSSNKQELIVKKHIPYATYTSFDTCDASKVLVKLKEFNSQVNDGVNEADLEKVITLTQKSLSDDAIVGLKKIMNWPTEKLFPVLDIVRLAVRSDEFCTKIGALDLLEFLAQKIPTNAANQLMSIRALCNMMIHKTGRDQVSHKLHDFIRLIADIRQGTANLQNAIATFYLNQSIPEPSQELSRVLCIEIVQFLEWTSDPESTFRAYRALGNLVTHSSDVSSIVKTVDVLKDGLQRNRSSPQQKLAEISAELSDKLML